MKKWLLTVCAVLVAASAFAANRYATITTDGAVLDQRRILCGVLADTGGTNDLIIILYDNASAASGPKPIPPIRISGTENFDGVMLGNGIDLRNGLYADLTTSGGATVTIVYGINSCE